MFRHTPDTPMHERVTIRHAHQGDAHAIARLAALDSARVPQGPALVAEAGDRIVAALPLRAGQPIADPFTHTAELVALLRLRAGQLGSTEPAPPPRARVLRLARA